MADADSIRAAIAAALPCEVLAVDGDGRHWTALVVSNAFDGLCAACHRTGDDDAAREWGRRSIEEKTRLAAERRRR